VKGLILTAALFLIPASGRTAPAEETVHLQIITVDNQEKLQQVWDLLAEDADFEAVARDHSTHVTAGSGGYLGERRLEGFTEEIRSRVAEAEAGAVVRFRSPALGYTIIRKLAPETARLAYAKEALETGKRRLEQGAAEQAVAELRRSLALNPRSPDAHMFLGLAYDAIDRYGRFNEVRAELQQALALNPELVTARFVLATMYLDAGRLERARAVLEERLELTERTPRLLTLLGEVHRRLGNRDEALEFSRRALKKEGSLASAHYHLALALLDLGQDDQALGSLVTAVQSGEATPDMFLRLGLLYLDQGRLEEAEQTLNVPLQKDPAFPEARLLLARVKRKQGALEAAFRELDMAVSGTARLPRGTAYSLGFEVEAHLEAARIFEAMGRRKEAIGAYRNALELDSQNAGIHLSLAEELLKEGRPEDARQHAVRARELGADGASNLLDRIGKSRQRQPAALAEGPH